ncbi:MFS transporter [Verticiella sediminum]|uniref:MFS transporter n=1 Tax=Verticiella sediminum TaxID=1247510 RepID=A0A556AIJ8_9BURK|nr:MFS transporter [Verticiella sediminum]TSH92734.1 MFS transporter [Verticiella sediminum]
MIAQRLARLVDLRRGEAWPVACSVGFFFCVLTSLMMLRPAREALGMQSGLDAVRWLFVGTAVATLLLNPVFGWLVSRHARMRVLVATYGFFALSLLGFFALLVGAPEAVGRVSGQVFYVWFSVFNLFATMAFWALMADRYTLEQSKRFFALIAVGGTLGAIFGPWLASLLARPLGTAALLPVSAAFLALALVLAGIVARTQPTARGAEEDGVQGPVLGGSAWQGVRAVMRSPYLAGIAAYVLILAVMATLLYFTRLQMVAAQGAELDMRTALFARIDMLTQIATLVIQLFIAGRLMKRLGVPLALALLPITTALGFIGLAIVGSLAALIVVEAAFRAVQRAIMRPARETLFTVLGREDKYKAKAFVDTFVYRFGDVAGAQLEGALGRLAMGLAAVTSVAVPLCLVWAALAVWLGRRQSRLAAPPAPDAQRHTSITLTQPGGQT